MAKPKLSRLEEDVLRLMYDASKSGKETSTPSDMANRLGCEEDAIMDALNRLLALGYVSPPPPSTTLAEIDAKLLKLDPKAEIETPDRVVMASLLIGANEDAIMKLGLDPKGVRTIGDRLRRNGVWDAGGVDEPDSDTSFWMMCAIGHGWMERAYDHDKKTWLYRNTPEGTKHAAALIKRSQP